MLGINYNDIANKKNIRVDTNLLQEILGVPVVDTIAIKGIGVHELVDAALEFLDKPVNNTSRLKYGIEVENRIDQLLELLDNGFPETPSRWQAIQLLEGKNPALSADDKEMRAIISNAEKLAGELVSMHGEDISTIIAAERYALAASITEKVVSRKEAVRKLSDIMDCIPSSVILCFSDTGAILIVVLCSVSGLPVT